MFGYKETRRLDDTSSEDSSEGEDDRMDFPNPNLTRPIITYEVQDTLKELIQMLYRRIPDEKRGTREEMVSHIIEEIAFHYRMKYLWRESPTLRAIENRIGAASHPTTGSAMTAFYQGASATLEPFVKKWIG